MTKPPAHMPSEKTPNQFYQSKDWYGMKWKTLEEAKDCGQDHNVDLYTLPPQSPDQGAVEKTFVMVGDIEYMHRGQAEEVVQNMDREIEALKEQVQALTRPPLDLEGLKDGIIKLYDERQGYDAQVVLGCERNAIRFALDHLQAIRPDLFGGM